MSFIKLGRENKTAIDTTGKWNKENEDTNMQLIERRICYNKNDQDQKEFKRLNILKKLIRKKKEQKQKYDE